MNGLRNFGKTTARLVCAWMLSQALVWPSFALIHTLEHVHEFASHTHDSDGAADQTAECAHTHAAAETQDKSHNCPECVGLAALAWLGPTATAPFAFPDAQAHQTPQSGEFELPAQPSGFAPARGPPAA